MNPPPFSLLLLLCLTVCGSLEAQTEGGSKHAPRAPSPYAREQAADTNPAIAQQEQAIRAEIVNRPNSASLLYALALILRQEGKPHESLDAYTGAARLRSPTPEELRSVALDYVLLSDYDDAIRWLEKAVQMSPANPEILYSLGRCYYSRDRYLDAGRMYERILALNPSHLKAEENLGLVYDATNQPEKAEAALRKAAGLAGTNGPDEWPFLDLGGFLLDQDRPQEAIDPLRIAARIQPSCAPCHEKLGRALLSAQDLAESIRELETATTLEPNNPKTHYELGRALRQAGQSDRAKQEFAASQRLYSAHSQE